MVAQRDGCLRCQPMDGIYPSLAQGVPVRGNRNEPNVARGHPLGRIREVLGNCYGQHGTERSVESQPTAALVGQDRGSQRAVVPSSDPATERMSMHLKEGSRARCTQWWTECAAG